MERGRNERWFAKRIARAARLDADRADDHAGERSYLEQASRLPWATLTGAAGAGWVAPGWAGIPSANVMVARPAGGAAATEHAYTVEWRVTDIGVAPICLRDVEVRVTWDEQGLAAAKTTTVNTRRYNQGDSSC
jgi:hypothetical protein